MKAVVIEAGRLHVADRPEPEPTGRQLLVRVEAAGLNNADLLQVRGLYPPPQGAPRDIPGLELVGEVVGRGPESRLFKEGDRVMGLVAGGAQAEYAVVDERNAVAAPASLSVEQAGAFMEAFVTAHDALRTAGKLSAGARVLVTGASGGVGTACVQLSSFLQASVAASTRHEEHIDRLLSLGADQAFPPEREEEFAPYDVIVELTGGRSTGERVRLLSYGGRLVLVGIPEGAKGEIPFSEMMARLAFIAGRTLRARSVEQKEAAIRSLLTDCGAAIEQGRLAPPIHATFPLEKAESAYGAFAEGGKFGKIVLTAA